MKTIKNFNTAGGEISLSFNISNINGILPIYTEVRLLGYENGKLTDDLVAFSQGNTANIPVTLIGDSNNGILRFATSLVYDNPDSLLDKIKALDLKYTLMKGGQSKVFTTYDSYYVAPQKKIVRIIKNIELS